MIDEVQQLRMQLADHGEHITRLEVDNERLRKSLAWYANFENWRGNGMQDALVFHDYGERARAALERKP